MDSMRLEIDDLRQRLEDADEVVAILRSTSEPRAIELLDGLRSAPDVPTFLAHLGSRRSSAAQRSQASSPERSTVSSQLSSLPPSQSSMEFELMIRHAIAYPTLFPVEATRTDVQKLSRVVRYSVQVPSENRASLISPILQEPEVATPPSKPYNLCDHRLTKFQLRRWTNVSATDDLAAAVISVYLETDHPVLGLFDADLFLDDLIAGKSEFCSSLLVCALLCWACQAYAKFEPVAGNLSLAFWDTAEQLWMQEKGAPLLTTVAASQLMSLAGICHGKDAQAYFYLKEGVRMGKVIGLYGVSESSSAQLWLNNHVEWKRAASQTAWGVFNWVTFRCLHYRTGLIETPPHLPIPGEAQSGQNTDVHNQPDAPPLHLGKTFTAMCRFWPIIHRVIWSYYDSEDYVAPESRAHFSFAEDAYRRLLHWADELPLDLARSSESAHHVVIAHIYLHASITDIFRPFLRGPIRFSTLEGFSSETSSPEAVFLASIKQLKRLLLVYKANFASADYCFLWHTVLLYVANAMLRKRELGVDPEWETWFRVCLSGYKDLFRCFKVAKTIYRSLLSMAMRNGVMTAAVAQDAIDQLGDVPSGPNIIEEPASMIVDFDLAMTDPLAARAGTLAEQFRDLALFDEFTTSTTGVDGAI